MENLAHPADAMTPALPRERRCQRKSNGLLVAAIAVGFLIWWPIGMALLAWTIWRDRLTIAPRSQRVGSQSLAERTGVANLMNRRPSNSALAAYLAREQERLSAEQKKLDELVSAFDSFKEAESRAADQRDFDSFLSQHATDASSPNDSDSKPSN